MPGENHGWISLDRYLAIHRSCLDQVQEYLVLNQDLSSPIILQSQVVRFSGVIQCHDDIEIHVNLDLKRDNHDRVRGRQFRYHAQRRLPEVARTLPPRVIYILRYDNADHFPEHPDRFHKHLFTFEGKPAGVEHIGRERFPTLRNVIDEVYEWWKQHRERFRGNR